MAVVRREGRVVRHRPLDDLRQRLGGVRRGSRRRSRRLRSPPRGAAGSRAHRRGSGTRRRTARRRRRCWRSSTVTPADCCSASNAQRAEKATPSITARTISGAPARESIRAKTPREALSQIGARSPSRCGRNSGTALDGAMLPASLRQRGRDRGRALRRTSASAAPPDLRRRGVHDDALVGRKEDHARRRVDRGRDDAGDLAGAALVHRIAIGDDADAEHAAPGVHRRRRRPACRRRADPCAHAPGDMAEREERRQALGRAGHEVEQRPDIARRGRRARPPRSGRCATAPVSCRTQ